MLGEFARLARTLFTDGMHFIALRARSRTALAAENLFLRKQLAFYQERKVVPRRFDNVSRLILVLLSNSFAWKDALVNVTLRVSTVLALEVAARTTADTTGTARTEDTLSESQS